MVTDFNENDSMRAPMEVTVTKNEDVQKRLDRIKGRIASLHQERNNEELQKCLDRIKGRVELHHEEGAECNDASNGNKDKVDGSHVESRQDESPKLTLVNEEERIAVDVAKINLKSDEKASGELDPQAPQNCPVCSNSLLHNYNPNDGEQKKMKCVWENSTCSITLPLQGLFNTCMPSSSEVDGDAYEDEKRRQQLIKKMENGYCTNCKVYVVRDDELLSKRKKQLQEVKREMAELDEQHKLRIGELKTSHNQQVVEMKCEKLYRETKHSQQLNELESIKREQEKKIAALFAKVYTGEQLRRKLHNHLQDLRGNIRVFVRTRPFIPIDGKQMGEKSPIVVSHDHESLSFLDGMSRNKHDFQFDRVFSSSTNQEVVFEEVSDFVQSALDGYNVCLFAYGQTGSGKTYTMQGSGADSERGIIPRALEEILSQAKSLESDKFEYKMKASFLEIYNEKLIDLLAARRDSQAEANKLAIKRSKEGRSYVENLTQIDIDSKNPENGMRRFDTLMSTAMHSRSVAETNMSTHSSRSHAVFILDLEGINRVTGAVQKGSLNLCDLAGSERVKRAGTASDKTRLREAQSVNKSLCALGQVFNALANKASHVPYRNSKLTFLLQDCLSGDGKALMLVNLSPTVRSGGESLCSLRFAQQVKRVSFGKVKRNVEYKKK